METIKSVFSTLNAVNCNEHTEKKNNLTYLSWAWAWAEVKKLYPNASYTIYENANQWNYFTDGKTCWVKTGVTIEGLEHIEYLPVMDFRNNSIPADKVTSFDVNKAIQRSLTKACARHGLGLYIYAGEDLPEEEQPTAQQPAQPKNDMDILKLIAEVNACTTSADVTKMWNAHPELKSNEAFKAAVASRGKELKAKEGAA
jgi:hypothetical protein